MLMRYYAAGSTLKGRTIALTSALLGAAFFFLLLHLGFGGPTAGFPSLRYSSSSYDDPPLHFLFPLDQRSHGPRSCKTLLAALVNGYTPTIVH
jgi:hypothetical protein